MPRTWHLVTPDAALFERLLPVARRIFTDTFSSLYDEAAFEAFCDEVYSSGGSMARDFAAPDIGWRVATADGAPVGYAKLTPLRAPAICPAPGSFELQQIYLLPAWHGTGIADALVTRHGYTSRRLGYSLDDLVRRRLLTPHAARRVSSALRRAKLLPSVRPQPAVERLRDWARDVRARRRPSTPRTALDYGTVFDTFPNLARARAAEGRSS